MWMQALNLKDLQESKRHKMKVNEQEILLLWHQDRVHAIQSKCPHFKLPLMKGELTDKCEIVCPFHKSAFDLKSGDVACWSPWPPVLGSMLGKISKEKQLKVYPTKIEEEVIWVDA